MSFAPRGRPENRRDDVAVNEREAETLRLLRARLDEGFRRLLMDHGGAVLALLMREFGGEAARQEAEDAMSAALHRVWQKIDTFDPDRASLRTWYYVIARNRLRSRRKADRNHRLASEVDLFERVADSNDSVGDDPPPLRVIVLDACIAQLRGLQRDVILADLEAGGVADASELARAFDTSTNTIYATRSKARRRLRELIVELESERGHA